MSMDRETSMTAPRTWLARLRQGAFQALGGLAAPPGLPEPGLRHYLHETPGERSRLHLRINPDGRGVLLVNASRMLHLNPTAAQMAYFWLEGVPPAQAVRAITARYRIPRAQAQGDYDQLCADLQELVRPEGACPVCDLNVELTAPFSDRPTAPYRMDLALTYRCNNDCAHCYNVSARDDPELSTQEWQRILDRLWQIGVPHIVFTGGEPTLRTDLPELIAYANRLGQITGLNTNGRRLSDPAFLDRLVQAGLDHVQVTLESHDPQIHDQMVRCRGAWKQTAAGVRQALDTRLFVMTNTTLLSHNAPALAETLDFLSSLGVPTIGLNALIYSGRGASVGTGLQESQLPALLALARQHTQEHGQRLIWYTPTQYCHFDPVQLELGVKGCTAALYNMCVEPDGGVLPCQSYYRQVGNLLTNDWESIWNHELCLRLRERRYVPQGCQGCTLLQVCGGGCPLRLEAEPDAIPQVSPVLPAEMIL
jgi:radical SAM protein with 4Fe4S-binding SPASM domain